MDERIIKYCQGNLSKEEQDQLLKEAYKDPVLKSRIIDYQHLHSLLELTPERMDKEQGRINYACFRKLVNVQKRKVMLISFSRYAAIIVIAFVSAWMLASYYFSGNLAEQKELIAFQQELLVPAGQRAELTLPDGTKVWLNAGSKLSYPSFFEKERKVFLSGEGFFNVAKNEKVPFIVSTGTIDVKALGTQFNVFCYPGSDYTGVYLQQGSVKAYFPSLESEGVVLSPEQYLVQKGKRLKLFYITQVAVKPPTFVIFVNEKQLMHFSYTRYLENRIREAFGFRGTALKFFIRERKEKEVWRQVV